MDRLVSLLQPGFLQLLIPLRWGINSLEEIQKFLDNMVLTVLVSSKYCHSENTESTEIAESTVNRESTECSESTESTKTTEGTTYFWDTFGILLGYIWDNFKILLGTF